MLLHSMSIISVQLFLIIKSVTLLKNEVFFWQDFCYPENCAEQH